MGRNAWGLFPFISDGWNHDATKTKLMQTCVWVFFTLNRPFYLLPVDIQHTQSVSVPILHLRREISVQRTS